MVHSSLGEGYLTDMWPRRQCPGLSHPGDRQIWSEVTAQSWIAAGWAGVTNQGWAGTRGRVPYVPGDGNSLTIPSKPCLMGKSGCAGSPGLSSVVKGLLTPSNLPDLKNMTHYLVNLAPANQQVGPGRKEQQNTVIIFLAHLIELCIKVCLSDP